MSNPLGETPEEMVKAVVANAQLAGGHIEPRFAQEVLLPLARGDIDGDTAVWLAINWPARVPPELR